MEQLEKQQAENLERFKVRTKELKSSVAKELQEATLDAAGTVAVVLCLGYILVLIVLVCLLSPGLRRLIQIKNKELRQMKSLAATILDQRTEVEQFFLEALQEVCIVYLLSCVSSAVVSFCLTLSLASFLPQVKEAIRKERHKNQMETRKTLNKLRSGAGAGGDPLQQSMSQKLGMFPPLNVKGTNLHLLEPRKPTELHLSDIQKVQAILSCSHPSTVINSAY